VPEAFHAEAKLYARFKPSLHGLLPGLADPVDTTMDASELADTITRALSRGETDYDGASRSLTTHGIVPPAMSHLCLFCHEMVSTHVVTLCCFGMHVSALVAVSGHIWLLLYLPVRLCTFSMQAAGTFPGNQAICLHGEYRCTWHIYAAMVNIIIEQ
jgi:hypothetical protein